MHRHFVALLLCCDAIDRNHKFYLLQVVSITVYHHRLLQRCVLPPRLSKIYYSSFADARCMFYTVHRWCYHTGNVPVSCRACRTVVVYPFRVALAVVRVSRRACRCTRFVSRLLQYPFFVALAVAPVSCGSCGSRLPARWVVVICVSM